MNIYIYIYVVFFPLSFKKYNKLYEYIILTFSIIKIVDVIKKNYIFAY